MIDGRTYTNSLEALDHSYARGFRLFELDIIVTADGKYVAAHDWKNWNNKSGLNGELPPDHAAFMHHPILEKYTPLDMERINDWFTAHPDAVLVTDKINEPAEFARRFVDKKRLMMEIFSKAALIEALAVGIAAAMPSQNLITGSQGLSPTEMKAMGITSVAVSRRLIDRNLPLIGELGELGIKTYVFHVNFEEGKDERFVVCHDMNFIYGLYADSYDFSEPAVCN